MQGNVNYERKQEWNRRRRKLRTCRSAPSLYPETKVFSSRVESLKLADDRHTEPSLFVRTVDLVPLKMSRTLPLPQGVGLPTRRTTS